MIKYLNSISFTTSRNMSIVSESRQYSSRSSFLLAVQYSAVCSYVTALYNNRAPFLIKKYRETARELIQVARDNTREEELIHSGIEKSDSQLLLHAYMDKNAILMALESLMYDAPDNTSARPIVISDKTLTNIKNILFVINKRILGTVGLWLEFLTNYNRGETVQPMAVQIQSFCIPCRDRHDIDLVPNEVLGFEYKPDVVKQLPLIAQFVFSVRLETPTIDNYMALLSSWVIEPSSPFIDANSNPPLATLLQYYHEQNVVCALTNPHRFIGNIARVSNAMLLTIVPLLSMYRCPCGLFTGFLIEKLRTAYINDSASVNNAYNYIRLLLSDDSGPDEDVHSAFVSHECYTEALDIHADSFIPFAKDETFGETLSQMVRMASEDDADPTDDSGDAADSSDADGEPNKSANDDEIPDEPKEQTDDSKLLIVELDSIDDVTLDGYLYRTQVAFLIKQIIASPPADISSENIAILKGLSSQWLYLMNVKSIKGLLKKLVPGHALATIR